MRNSQTYPVTFPIAKKTNVNGSDANEVFKWLKGASVSLVLLIVLI